MQNSLFEIQELNEAHQPPLQQCSVSRSTLYNGDCLIESDKIQNGSVDLILTDLPYGVVKMKESAGNYKVLNTAKNWDKAIEPKSIYEISNRILRKNGKMILFSQEPYTSRMITEAIPNVPFSYRAIWEKNDFANGLGVNKAMVSFYEDILIFSKTHDFEGIHPLRPYFKNVLEYIGLKKKTIVEVIGQSADHCFRVDSSQFSLCTEKTYNKIIEVYGIDKMEGFRTFADISTESDGLNSTFNLWEGGKFKSNVLKYKKDYNGYHPTQKPVLLLEDLIKTFSNENDLVVDLTMGSGSTGVAALRTGRRFVGIEKDENYFNIAVRRLSEYCG